MEPGWVDLDAGQCLELLSSTQVGRIAVTRGAMPAIVPVHFSLLDGHVVFRTPTAFDATVRRAVVAFQADHLDLSSPKGWSVQVVGLADTIEDPALLARARALNLRVWHDPGEVGDTSGTEPPRAATDLVMISPGLVSGQRLGPAG